MPLTRHLYREDEVLAALQFCVLHGRCVEAAFWATELLDSQMADEFIIAMRQIWLFGFGIGALKWYERFVEVTESDELDQEELLLLVVALCRIGANGGRDTSFLVLKGYKAQLEIVRECSYEPSTGLDAYFAASVLQGRAAIAAAINPLVSADTIATVAAYKHGDTGKAVIKLLSVSYPLLCIAALCLPAPELLRRWAWVTPPMLSEVETAIAEWDTLLHRRRRRIYPIPHGCLYWLTARGSISVYDSTEKEIMGRIERPGRLWGSTYWDAVVEPLGGWAAVKEDAEVREAFYEEHFPDDIPDEWSKKDRAMSHGVGASQPGTTPSTGRFLRTWFGKIPSAVVWNKLDVAIQRLEAAGAGTYNEIMEKEFHEKIGRDELEPFIVPRKPLPRFEISAASTLVVQTNIDAEYV